MNGELEGELNSLAGQLQNMGVTVVLVDAVDAVTAASRPASRDVSCLADDIVFLRFLESQGELRRALNGAPESVDESRGDR